MKTSDPSDREKTHRAEWTADAHRQSQEEAAPSDDEVLSFDEDEVPRKVRQQKPFTAEEESLSDEFEEYEAGLEQLKQTTKKTTARQGAIRSFLLAKFPNININAKVGAQAPVDDVDEDDDQAEAELKRQEEFVKRDRFLDDVHSSINEFNKRQRICNLQKLSKYDFDDVETPMDVVELKINRCHRLFLKIESVSTLRNFGILAVICFFLHVIVIPEAAYVLNAVDRHYYGYFNERAPLFADTTSRRKYFEAHGIPYVTPADVKAEHYRNAQRRLAGLPPTYLADYSEDELPTMPATTRLKKAFLKGKRALAGATAKVTSLATSKRTLETDPKDANKAAAANKQQPADPSVDASVEPSVEKLAAAADPEGARDGSARKSTTPTPLMPEEVIKNGGFLVYLLGIVYAFNGIALVTQNYINPAIDTIKKKGIIGSDTMNATLLAFSNSAAESFIVMVSIFYDLPDIGIQTAVQQTAFYALIIQGFFYLFAPEETRIDWWISTRDTVLFVFYLIIMSVFMQGNQIESYAIVILNILYFIHVFLMKLNYTYEVQLKKSFASFLEIRELNRLANLDINHFHLVLDTRHPSIEVLNKIDFKQEGDILIFPNGALNKGTGTQGQFMAKLSDQIKYRMKAIQRVKIREERFATPGNTTLMARARMKRAVIKILTKLQAYHFFERMKRNKKCIIPVTKFVKDYTRINVAQNSSFQDDNFGTGNHTRDNYYYDKSESDEQSESEMVTDSEASEGDDQASVDMSAQDGLEGDVNAQSSKAMFNMASNSAVEVNKKPEEEEKLKKEVQDSTIKVTGQLSSGRQPANMQKSDAKIATMGADKHIGDHDQFGNDSDQEEHVKQDWQHILLEEKMMGEPQTIPQSIIYQLVNETINKDGYTTECPKGIKNIIWYILMMPLTHLQYITIPDPLSKRNSNYYPVTLICSITWICFYCIIIVWFTHDVTEALGLPASILPMFLYPFCVSIRDKKKFDDFALSLEVFQQELPDQEITLAETYAPQIFQMTGCAGVAWLFYTQATGNTVVFENDSIQFQVPILICVILVKYVILVYNRFKTRRALCKANVQQYLVFVFVVLIVDYKDKISAMLA